VTLRIRAGEYRLPELCQGATFLPRAIEEVELLPTWDAPRYTLVLPDSAGRLVSAFIDEGGDEGRDTLRYRRTPRWKEGQINDARGMG
jgi:hypothetical protein